ncbi:MAG: hypothetical protein AAFN70_19700, partial [Planctomycetota bacterium]
MTNIDGSGFEAYGGTVISLPTISEYDLSPNSDSTTRNWIARGPGSKIDLSGVRWIRGGERFNTRMFIQADAGGDVDLRGVQQIVDPVEGNTSFRRFEIESRGDGSLVQLDALANVLDRNENATSSLSEFDSGVIRAPGLASLLNVSVDVSGSSSGGSSSNSGSSNNALADGSSSSSQSSSGAVISWLGGDGDWNDPTMWSLGVVPGRFDDVLLDSGTVTISGGDQLVRSLNGAGGLSIESGSLTLHDDSSLTGEFGISGGASLAVHGPDALLTVGGPQTIHDANFAATGGATLRFTQATEYRHLGGFSQSRNWYVEGNGSRLIFDALSQITGGTNFNTQLNISAFSGGRIE